VSERALSNARIWGRKGELDGSEEVNGLVVVTHVLVRGVCQGFASETNFSHSVLVMSMDWSW
jgi:hypothetical protein